jgi:hypothetical protein
MRLFRVAWVDPAWRARRPEEPFHPLYVPIDRQGGGRFDNPHRYAALYAATSAQAAVGEALANSAVWIAAEVAREKDGHPRCLVTFDVAEGEVFRDLDDPHVLVELGLRASDVVRRNRDHTQEIGLAIWLDRPRTASRGLRWRSYWRPEWEVVVVWSDGLHHPWFPFAEVVAVEGLALDHPAVVLAADVLPRDLR